MIKTAVEQQQEQEQYQNMLRASVDHTRRLAEAHKELSDKNYIANGEVIFTPTFFGTLGLVVKLTFDDSGEKIEFDGSVWPNFPLTMGQYRGYASFLVPPDKLMGFVTVYAQYIEPNPAIGGGLFLEWRRFDQLTLGYCWSPIDVTTRYEKFGSGLFRKG